MESGRRVKTLSTPALPAGAGAPAVADGAGIVADAQRAPGEPPRHRACWRKALADQAALVKWFNLHSLTAAA
jgi:hypothetical protein